LEFFDRSTGRNLLGTKTGQNMTNKRERKTFG
jgi:hypothetical protein